MNICVQSLSCSSGRYHGIEQGGRSCRSLLLLVPRAGCVLSLGDVADSNVTNVNSSLFLTVPPGFRLLTSLVCGVLLSLLFAAYRIVQVAFLSISRRSDRLKQCLKFLNVLFCVPQFRFQPENDRDRPLSWTAPFWLMSCW